jgi:hypothetical protein
MLSPEDLVISYLPDFPSSNCKSFHEVSKLPFCFGFLNGVKERQLMVPVNIQKVPASFSKRALKDQVISEFLQSWVAEDTRVVVSFNSEIISSEQIFGVDPISKNQPNENFEFLRYLCFPYPFERLRGFYVFET